MTVMSLGGAATEEDANLISQLFGSIGKIWKADDKYFDAITGLRYANLILQNDIIILPPFQNECHFSKKKLFQNECHSHFSMYYQFLFSNSTL